MNVLRVCLAVVVVLLASTFFLDGQTVPPSQLAAQPRSASARCTVRHIAPTAAEHAMEHRQFAEAIALYKEEQRGTPAEIDRAHDGEIRALLKAGRLTDAQAQADEWAKTAPHDLWSRLALSEVLWRRGKLNDVVDLIVEVSRLDNCNAQVHADFAQLLLMSGMRAKAKAQIDMAHKLEPDNPEFSSFWVDLQPRAVQLSELSSYIESNPAMPADQRKYLERHRERLASPPPNRCQLVGATQSTAIPFRSMQSGPNAKTTWGLTVKLNDKSRALQIDTGAHGLMLTRSAAAALHLVPDEKMQSWGVGDDGNVDSFIANVASIKIGGLEFQNCDVEVLNKNIPSMEAQDGLIGGDVFSNFLLTLDFPGHVLKLDPLPPIPGDTATATAGPSLATGVAGDDDIAKDRYIDSSMSTWTKVFRSEHDLILPVRLNSGPMRLFIVDTGSDLNLISREAAAEVAKVSNGSDREIYGISGQVKKLYTTGPLTLDFAGMRQASTGMTAMDTTRLGSSVGVEIAGFLGAPTLHQLTMRIDYRDDLLTFSFDPKRLRSCVSGMVLADCY